MDPVLIVAIVVVVLVIVVLVRSVKVIPQAQAAVIERLGRFNKASSAGLVWLVPFLDRIRARIDLREQVVSFPPQPVITEDNLTVSIDTVVYFQVTDPRAAVYEIANYIVAVEQLTTTTLRNVVGGMNLEQTLTSRDSINGQLRGVLDEATGKWGIRVARVELKAIDPPPSIQEAMEKQMRADRDKRAMILNSEGLRESSIKTAEGQKQAAVLTAEGAKQSAILAAEGERQSRILRAQGERAARYLQAQGQAKAIEKVFAAVKAGKPTPELLAYQYLQTLPQMAQGDANKVWMIPSDFSKSLEGFARMLGTKGDDGVFRYEPPKDEPVDPNKPVTRPGDIDEDVADWFEGTSAAEVAAAVRAVEKEAMVTIEDKDAARAAAYRDREIAAAPPRPQMPPGESGRHQGQQPPQQGNYPTQGYPGRDAPTGPATGYRPPDGERPPRPDVPHPATRTSSHRPGSSTAESALNSPALNSADPLKVLPPPARALLGLPSPLAVVGAGRLGTAIVAALRAAGIAVSGPHGRGYDGAGDALVLLCVPDDAIPAAAAAVEPGPLVGHCSGASGLDALGAREAFSLHPLMTVTHDGADFDGVFAAISGSTPSAAAVATALAATLQLRPVQVAEADRVAYHAAAAFAANFLVTVESAAAELMSTAGLDREVLLPLARAALENWARRDRPP